jgi:hypothetical protein
VLCRGQFSLLRFADFNALSAASPSGHVVSSVATLKTRGHEAVPR